MDEPRHDVRFEFSDAFELTDDAEVLLGFGCSALLMAFPFLIYVYISVPIFSICFHGACA